jgi:sulfite reductase (ferredoxin)
MHDMGMTAATRIENGEEKRGFEVCVGGGLGAVPYQAKPFDSFVPVEELLPLAQSISRVFARLGEKKNRSRARLKFLVQDLGIEKFKELVVEERKTLTPDARWTEFVEDAEKFTESPLRPGGKMPLLGTESFQRWVKTNTRPQRQAGYTVVTVKLPLGDITANQLRSLADIARRFTKETIRSTVEQNIILRWVSQSDLLELHKALVAAGLGDSGAGTIVDIAACPGTDTCKLGISSSRGLAAELRKRLGEKSFQLEESVDKLHIKISGCFNSCGQHHIADLGFYGVSRKMAGYAVPHFQVVLGGEWEHNGASYGIPVIAIPSKNIPEVVSRLTDRYAANRKSGESFKEFVVRTGKVELKRMLEDLARPPAGASDRSFFQDWGDPREYSLSDIATGECAGEVVSSVDFELAAAERELFEAQVAFEDGQIDQAGQTAYRSMLRAAKALVKIESSNVTDAPADIIGEFRTRFYDTQKFFDPFAGGKFAHYLFSAHQKSGEPHTKDSTRYLIDEAQLLIASGKRTRGMDFQHVNVKLLIENPEEVELEPLIPVFHTWIEDQNGDELLIDVADYTHVPAGPGIVLVGHEGNYSVDNTDNRLGVRYNRKAALDGTNQERLAQAVRAALTACQRLESEPRMDGKLRFNGQDIEIFLNDRLIAPNNNATREAAESDFQVFFQKLFRGKEYSMNYGNDPRQLFTAYVKAAQPVSVSELLEALE